MVQQTVIVVQPEEQRAQQSRIGGITETADHAVGAANLFHFHHGSPLARRVRRVNLLCNHAVEIATNFIEPFLRDGELSGCRR